MQQTKTSMVSSFDEAFSIHETTAAGKEKTNKLEAETQQRKMSSEKSERISCQLTVDQMASWTKRVKAKPVGAG